MVEKRVVEKRHNTVEEPVYLENINQLLQFEIYMKILTSVKFLYIKPFVLYGAGHVQDYADLFHIV